MRQPTVSIITALADRPAPRLPEIHAVLTAAPEEWEWLLQLDGDAETASTLPAAIRDDPRVAIERNGRQLGIAATRNGALARARAPARRWCSTSTPMICRARRHSAGWHRSSRIRASAWPSETGSSAGPTGSRGPHRCASPQGAWPRERCRGSGARSAGCRCTWRERCGARMLCSPPAAGPRP